MLGIIRQNGSRNSVQNPRNAQLLKHDGKAFQNVHTKGLEVGIVKKVVCCSLVVSQETALYAVDTKALGGPENQNSGRSGHTEQNCNHFQGQKKATRCFTDSRGRKATTKQEHRS